ncbi:chemotaxis protein CheB [Planobispora rosea]|uniref:protein-glutamate methylesterase n=1 Tax=Planobispora rosea TaxID=35762 RepID=A0A8J3RWB4_PLARO|nr:chemotaxis protein CheB [Planobispora rosea]GGS50541.1 chemotaxis protein CheB [Planobispora rosea]GIH82530.1 chemotaxis protein CheB [Planobispora rosea]
MSGFSRRDLVVVAASAGGVESLRALMAALPGDLPASLLLVLHIPPRGGSALAGILDRAGPLKAAPAVDGEPLRHGRVYVAPPDHHLLVHDATVRLSRGPRHNGHRPAADPLFMSAAIEGGPRTLAVVLSGMLDDGSRGCALVERYGGAVAVQDPEESLFAGMPRAALDATRDPEVLPVAEIARLIVRQSGMPAGEEERVPDPQIERDAQAEREVSLFLRTGRPTTPAGDLTGFTCPECNGPLYETGIRPYPRYECRVGHVWSAQTMADGQAVAVERALWVAILRLEERLRVLDRLTRNSERRGHTHSVQRFRDQAEEIGEALETMRMLQSRIGGFEDDLLSS